MTPYYDDGQIQIWHADARDVLPTLAVGSIDLVLTDPPYGIAAVWQGGFGRGWKSDARIEAVARNEWDGEPPDRKTLDRILAIGKDAVIWGGHHFDLPPSRGWLVWNKPERGFSLADAELAWTTRDMVIRVFDYPRSESARRHPTQKPVALFRWCIGFFPHVQTILDPYMGSGTALRAAKDLGLRAVGIEREERWCEYAVKRLAQTVLPLEMVG